MKLRRSEYYADFVIYPLLVTGLFLIIFDRQVPGQVVDWLVLCALGVGCWTLVEYAAHRFLLHQAPILERLHTLHHAAPKALIGTPPWMSVPMILGSVLVPLAFEAEFDLACGATAGIMLGYLWYTVVHHAIHHWHPSHDTYFYRAKHRHALHHLGISKGNYGVTTAFWDQAFGTALPHRIKL